MPKNKDRPRFKTTFSWTPYIKKKRQLRQIEENRRQFEQEMRERRRWAIKKSFNEDAHLKDWDGRKKTHEKFFTNLSLEMLSLCDAANSANEVLAQGLGLKETAIDLESVEDLAYNIGMVKMAETFCSSEAANLNKENQDRVMQLIVGQLFPQPMLQKPPASPARGDEILEKLQAIRTSRSN